METGFNAGKAVRVSSFDLIDIYRVYTDKFKTNSIHFFFRITSPENVTKTRCFRRS